MAELSNNREGAKVAITLGQKRIKFGPSCEKQSIYVFNSDFVNDHLYRGNSFAVRRFDSSVVTEEQLKNPKIAKLEKDTSKKQAELKLRTDEKAQIDSRFEMIKQSLSKELNLRIKGSRMPTMSIPATAPTSSLDDLKAKLEKAYKNHDLGNKQEELQSDIKEIGANSCEKLTTQLASFRRILSTQIAIEARKKVQEKIDTLVGFSPKYSTVNEWFQDGYHLLEHVKSNENHHCPLCGSDIRDSISSLIDEYASFFNEDYDKLLKDINGLIATVETDLTRIGTNRRSYDLLIRLERKYADLGIDSGTNPGLADDTIRRTLEHVKSELETKKSNVSYSPKKPEKDSDDAISRYNDSISTINQRQTNLQKSLRDLSADPKQALNTIREVIPLCGYGELEEYDGVGCIARYQATLIELEKINRDIEKLTINLTSEIANLRNESKYVNSYLRQLGISHFKIAIQDKSEIDNITIQFNSGNARSKLRHSLSEGEKTALAFSYFLSKIQYEVVDNKATNLNDTIIVIDDPVSSLDEDRLHTTACMVESVFKDARQLFVLSHNIGFMRFLSKVVGHPVDKTTSGKESQLRQDYYLSTIDGCLEQLPPQLRNYSTTYFQRLHDIIALNDCSTTYEEVKSFMPTYVRTVLETFLSFKLSVLTQGSSGDKFKSAGMDKLIACIKGSIGLFSEFNKVGDIESLTLISTLQDIKRITDPQVHGTPHDIDNISFISEHELRRITKNVIDVIAFVDQIHLNRVKQMGTL